jgi:hypothetical protein
MTDRLAAKGDATTTGGRILGGSSTFYNEKTLLAATGKAKSKDERGSSSFRATGPGTAKIRRARAAATSSFGTAHA